MILKRKQEIERFLAAPDAPFLAAVIHGRDLVVVRERARALSARVTQRPEDPFDVALLSDADLDADPARLEEELSAVSMMGGRRLVRLRLSGDRPAVDRAAAEGLKGHLAGKGNPDAFFLVEAGELGRDSALKKVADVEAICISGEELAERQAKHASVMKTMLRAQKRRWVIKLTPCRAAAR